MNTYFREISGIAFSIQICKSLILLNINFNLIDDDLTLYSKFKRISITNYINNINEYNESSNTLYDYLYNHKSNIDFLNKYTKILLNKKS